MKIYRNIFEQMISVESLLTAWHNFKSGKRKKLDVAEFELHLEKNIFGLHRELISGQYKHSLYQGFYIQDPKLRHIHKAQVKDRVVHQAVYSVLSRIYDSTFIHDSYSCRINKGTHKAIARFEHFNRKITHNYTAPCYALKCDIQKFFNSVDHQVLLSIIARRIRDRKALALFKEIIESFQKQQNEGLTGKGIPIGNLTSQIFGNIYMNELDQFVKHELNEKYYIRYADDFVFLSTDKNDLKNLIPKLETFLAETLKMEMHPNKVILQNTYQGVDFLGYVIFPKHKVLRNTTKRRMLKKMDKSLSDFLCERHKFEKTDQVFQSYFGIMGHGNGHKLSEDVREKFWPYAFSKDSGIHECS